MINTFKTLSEINVNSKTENKGNLTYLSWTFAWSEVKKRFPDASYKVWKDENGNPYTYNETLGYMCYTTVTIEEETLEMWLPVMDGKNKSMRNEAWTYEVKKWQSTEMETKHVSAATMFDINKTIMRCLVKNLAMFGLGLYIFAGEDLPEAPEVDLNDCKTLKELQEAYKSMSKADQLKNKDLKDKLKVTLK